MTHSIRAAQLTRRLFGAAVVASGITAGTVALPSPVHTQWSTTYEQYYLPGKFNFTFRRDYPGADRLFNAFDYGQPILYERLYNDAHAPVSELENDEFNFITRKLLVR
jgi:hypothetical protein